MNMINITAIVNTAVIVAMINILINKPTTMKTITPIIKSRYAEMVTLAGT